MTSFDKLDTMRSLGVMLLMVASAHAAVISAPSGSIGTVGARTITVSFTAEGAAVSGIQFDLTWGSPLTVHATVSDAIRAAGKNVYLNPKDSHTIRCIIVGPDQKQMPDGAVLQLSVAAPAGSSGHTEVAFSNQVAVSPQGDAVVLKTVPAIIQILTASTEPLSGGVVNAASLVPGPVSPGEILTMFGAFGEPAQPSITFGGAPGVILYTGPDQWNVIAPFRLDTTQPVEVELTNGGSPIARDALETAASSPGIFVVSGTGSGNGAILNQDATVNAVSHPAPGQTIVSVFGTGFGRVAPIPQDGAPVEGIAYLELPVTARIAGLPAEVTYAGSAPGLVAGVTQINLRVPVVTLPDSFASLELATGDGASQQGATIALE